MPHGILYRLNLLLRTSRLFTVRRFGFVIILPFYNPMLLFYLSDIEISHAISVFFFYPVPYGVICCTLLKSVRIHILQIELHTDLFALDISLGKQDNSLDKTDLMKQINRLRFSEIPANYQLPFAELLNSIIEIFCLFKRSMAKAFVYIQLTADD